MLPDDYTCHTHCIFCTDRMEQGERGEEGGRPNVGDPDDLHCLHLCGYVPVFTCTAENEPLAEGGGHCLHPTTPGDMTTHHACATLGEGRAIEPHATPGRNDTKEAFPACLLHLTMPCSDVPHTPATCLPPCLFCHTPW